MELYGEFSNLAADVGVSPDFVLALFFIFVFLSGFFFSTVLWVVFDGFGIFRKRDH